MGTAQSIEEIEDHVDRLKQEVDIFNGSITSYDYARLQKDLVQTNSKILKIKSSCDTTYKWRCDDVLNELNKCLQTLTQRVTQNTSQPDKPPSIPIKKKPKRDAEDIIIQYEQEAIKIELEVEEILNSHNYTKKKLVEGKLKLAFTELAIANVEKRSYLDIRKDMLLEKLYKLYNQIQGPATQIPTTKLPESYDSDFDSDFDSEEEGYRSNNLTAKNSKDELDKVKDEPIYENMEFLKKLRLVEEEVPSSSISTENHENQKIQFYDVENLLNDMSDDPFAVLKLPPKKRIQIPPPLPPRIVNISDDEFDHEYDDQEKHIYEELKPKEIEKPIGFSLEDDESSNKGSNNDYQEWNEAELSSTNKEFYEINDLQLDDQIKFGSDDEEFEDEVCNETFNTNVAESLYENVPVESMQETISENNWEVLSAEPKNDLDVTLNEKENDQSSVFAEVDTSSSGDTVNLNTFVEELDELKEMKELFQETKDYKIHGEIQNRLMQLIKLMFNINRENFDRNSLILYEIVSQNIQKLVNEL